MAANLLTVDGVNSFVTDWTAQQTKQKVDPLTAKKKTYDDTAAAYTSLTDKLTALKNSAYILQLTGSSSAFLSKKATSSDTTFADLTATSAAVSSSASLRINQLAKSDIVISNDLNSTDASTTITAPGTHTFTITAGDGKGGVLTSNVTVTFDTSDFTNGSITNQAVVQKVQDAINSDKAVAQSNSVSGSIATGGSFNVNLGGTVTTINYTAGAYSDVFDKIVSQINSQIAGINAQKVADGSGGYKLMITVSDSSKYLTLSGDTGGLLSTIGLSANQIMGASGLVNASMFSPTSDLSQLSIATAKSGIDYKILSMSDTNGGQVLSTLGINFGSSRPTFAQDENGPDTPGFVYTTDQLNAKFLYNGIKVQRDSNSISDLIPGATVTLKSLMQSTDTDVNLSIASDSATVMGKIQDFIKAYNDAYLYIQQNTQVQVVSTGQTTSTTSNGVLNGDPIATNLQELFLNEANVTVPGLNSADLNSLSRIGITFSVSDGLTVSDSNELQTAINNKPNQVEAIFNSANGIANVIYNRVNPYVNATGYLYQAKQNLQVNEQYITDEITSANDQISKDADNLRLRYMKTMTQTNAMLAAASSFVMNSGASFLSTSLG